VCLGGEIRAETHTPRSQEETPRLAERRPGKLAEEVSGRESYRNRITESYHRRATEQHLMMKNVSILGRACTWHLGHWGKNEAELYAQ